MELTCAACKTCAKCCERSVRFGCLHVSVSFCLSVSLSLCLSVCGWTGVGRANCLGVDDSTRFVVVVCTVAPSDRPWFVVGAKLDSTSATEAEAKAALTGASMTDMVFPLVNVRQFTAAHPHLKADVRVSMCLSVCPCAFPCVCVCVQYRAGTPGPRLKRTDTSFLKLMFQVLEYLDAGADAA